MTSKTPFAGSLSKETDHFYIKSIGWLRRHKDSELQRPQTCRSFMLVWINTGVLIHCIDGRNHTLSGALYCVAPGKVHQLFCSDDATGYIVRFDPSDMEGLPLAHLLFRKTMSNDSPLGLYQRCVSEQSGDLTAIFHELEREFDRYSMLRPGIIYSFVKILILHLAFDSNTRKTRYTSLQCEQIVEKFFSLLDQDFKTKRRVEEYASELSITPNYLNEQLKKATGRPPSFHIKSRIILEAKRQIIYHGMNLKETAYFLGFDDLAYFSKYFKKTLGISFSEFKRTAGGIS